MFDTDKDFDGQRLSEGTVVSLDSNYLRVYAVNMVDYKYYYKDVNKKTLEVGELHPEEGTMGGYTQGKDCLMYTILQEQDPILEIKR